MSATQRETKNRKQSTEYPWAFISSSEDGLTIGVVTSDHEAGSVLKEAILKIRASNVVDGECNLFYGFFKYLRTDKLEFTKRTEGNDDGAVTFRDCVKMVNDVSSGEKKKNWKFLADPYEYFAGISQPHHIFVAESWC